MGLHSLSEKDAKHVQAAEGWFELDNYLEANAALDEITPAFRAHPDVLEVRWKIFAAGRQWEACRTIAKVLTDQVPERVYGWLFLAASHQMIGNIRGAYDALVSVVDEFKHVPAVSFDLARYACLLGNYQDAQRWIGLAIKKGGNEMKFRALDEPDLKDFWANIGQLGANG